MAHNTTTDKGIIARDTVIPPKPKVTAAEIMFFISTFILFGIFFLLGLFRRITPCHTH